jgi:hypothetical protein
MESQFHTLIMSNTAFIEQERQDMEMQLGMVSDHIKNSNDKSLWTGFQAERDRLASVFNEHVQETVQASKSLQSDLENLFEGYKKQQGQKLDDETQAMRLEFQDVHERMMKSISSIKVTAHDGMDGKHGADGRDGKDGLVPEVEIDHTNHRFRFKFKGKKPTKWIILPKSTTNVGGGLDKVYSDATLSGQGTVSSPLSVVGGGGSLLNTTTSITLTNLQLDVHGDTTASAFTITMPTSPADAQRHYITNVGSKVLSVDGGAKDISGLDIIYLSQWEGLTVEFDTLNDFWVVK